MTRDAGEARPGEEEQCRQGAVVEPQEGQIWEITDGDKGRLVRLGKTHMGPFGARLVTARIINRETLEPVQRRVMQLTLTLLRKGAVGGRTARLVAESPLPACAGSK